MLNFMTEGLSTFILEFYKSLMNLSKMALSESSILSKVLQTDTFKKLPSIDLLKLKNNLRFFNYKAQIDVAWIEIWSIILRQNIRTEITAVTFRLLVVE